MSKMAIIGCLVPIASILVRMKYQCKQLKEVSQKK
jgi:hypothetical protein